jgi:hypothetical protein
MGVHLVNSKPPDYFPPKNLSDGWTGCTSSAHRRLSNIQQSPIVLTFPAYGCSRFTDQFSASWPLSPNGRVILKLHCPFVWDKKVWGTFVRTAP